VDYDQDDLLPLSGIQHFQFCRRQWALIHVERQWQENLLTAEGRLMHTRANQPEFVEVRDGVITSRAMPVASYRLGLYGVCDVVEFTPSMEGVKLHGREGRYIPVPVEYKHGREKKGECDEVQVCAQAMCLEEMMCVSIPSGRLFYGGTRHRYEVELNARLRDLVEKISAEMHHYFQRGYTPRVKPSKACASCSLKDVCLPVLTHGQNSASQYIQHYLDAE